MRRIRQFGDEFAPWAGVAVGLIALAIVHQYGSEGVFNDCATVSPGPVLIVAILGLSACAASGLLSWRKVRSSTSDARRVVGFISLGSAALFMFAIVLAMIAALMLPPCFQ